MDYTNVIYNVAFLLKVYYFVYEIVRNYLQANFCLACFNINFASLVVDEFKPYDFILFWRANCS
jgi:hypothetical protein